MLADRLDYVIGVDPHRDTHALALVDVRTGGVVLERSVSADSAGYQRALQLARRHATWTESVRDRRRGLVRCRSDACTAR